MRGSGHSCSSRQCPTGIFRRPPARPAQGDRCPPQAVRHRASGSSRPYPQQCRSSRSPAPHSWNRRQEQTAAQPSHDVENTSRSSGSPSADPFLSGRHSRFSAGNVLELERTDLHNQSARVRAAFYVPNATTAWDRLPGRCRMNCWDWTKAIATATAHGPAEFAPLGLTGWGEGRDALGLSHLTLRTTWTINFHWLDQPPFPCTSTIRRNRIRVNRCSGKSRYSKAKRLWEQRMTAPPSPEIGIAGVCSCRTGPRSISPQSNPESSRPRPSARTTGHPTACPHRCF